MALSAPLGLLIALRGAAGLGVSLAAAGALIAVEPRRHRVLAAPAVLGALVGGLVDGDPLLLGWSLLLGGLWLRAARAVNQSPLRGGPPV